MEGFTTGSSEGYNRKISIKVLCEEGVLVELCWHWCLWRYDGICKGSVSAGRTESISYLSPVESFNDSAGLFSVS